MGTVERRLTLEYFLEPYLKKKQKSWLSSLLYLSVYQLVYMNVKDYFVVDESVNIANVYGEKIGSFTNAVLRNFLRNPVRDIEIIYWAIDGDTLIISNDIVEGDINGT